MFNGLLSIFGWASLAPPRSACHSRAMASPEPTSPRRPGMAGGCLLAVSLIAGVIVGAIYREPSIGFLVGLGVGILLIVLVWLLERRR